MNIKIKETNEIKTLLLLDNNGINYVKDFIGNYDNSAFTWSEAEEIYTVDQDNYNWWHTVIANQQRVDNRIAKLREIHGYDAVDHALRDAYNCDIEDQAAYVNAALDVAFGEE